MEVSFIRGFFDGDGSVGTYRRSDGTRYVQASFWSGSSKFLERLVSVLRDSGLPPKKVVRRKDGVYGVRYHSRDVLKLEDYMYDGGMCLGRKQVRFKAAREEFGQQFSRVSTGVGPVKKAFIC